MKKQLFLSLAMFTLFTNQCWSMEEFSSSSSSEGVPNMAAEETAIDPNLKPVSNKGNKEYNKDDVNTWLLPPPIINSTNSNNFVNPNIFENKDISNRSEVSEFEKNLIIRAGNLAAMEGYIYIHSWNNPKLWNSKNLILSDKNERHRIRKALYERYNTKNFGELVAKMHDQKYGEACLIFFAPSLVGKEAAARAWAALRSSDNEAIKWMKNITNTQQLTEFEKCMKLVIEDAEKAGINPLQTNMFEFEVESKLDDN